MPEESQMSPAEEPQEQVNYREKSSDMSQEAPLAEKGERAETREAEKSFERAFEQTPPPAAPAKDDDKVKVLKEAEKLRDVKFEGRKIEHLLNLAQTKGVDFAIEVAKKTDDACLLDLLHDKLVEQKMKP
ncbi:MAG: hypothetical protein PHU56_03940 [Candidatus Pacebacteria bacterium]|nr:hypothetical protein [Candidatus Paceibacterota bacterium]